MLYDIHVGECILAATGARDARLIPINGIYQLLFNVLHSLESLIAIFELLQYLSLAKTSICSTHGR